MSDIVDILMPDSEEASEATVIGWHVSEGDFVKEHQPLLEISTDKVTLEVSAPASGKLTKVLVQENEVLHPGHILGKIDTSIVASTEPLGSDTRKAAPAAEPQTIPVSQGSGYEGRLSPLVRKMISENNLDTNLLQGTGRNGRITAKDVETYLASPLPGKKASSPIVGRLIPHTPMRRKIADHMVESMLKTSPHVTSIFDADMTAVLAHRAAHKSRMADQGINLTITAYFVTAAARALRNNPAINSRWREEGIEIIGDINIGIATALGDQGLIVPVINNADTLDLGETANRLNEVVSRARENRLSRSEVQGGTFTITNHGVSGSLIATPIINQPQAAILGIGKTTKRVVVDDSDGVDSIQVRPMVYITLTIDHRILDGFQANQFLSDFVNEIENWK